MGILASYRDANRHLDETKIRFVDDVDAADEAVAAFDTIASKVGALWPEHILLWATEPDLEADPPQEPVPAIIRQVASLLMASYRYSKKYSEEDLSENDYAARLERRAMALLDGIVAGTVVLWDVDYGTIVDSGAHLSRDDFWPNDLTTVGQEEIDRENRYTNPELESTRAFSMGMDL